MSLLAPSDAYSRLLDEIESAVDDVGRLRRLTRDVERSDGLDDDERDDLSMRAGRYKRGCKPEPLELV